MLASEMHKVHPDLTFEFGPVEEERREFVITAGGIKGAFHQLRLFVLCAEVEEMDFH